MIETYRTFHITSLKAGHRNMNYSNLSDAIEHFRSMPKDKQKRFGITCEEIRITYDENGNFTRRDTTETFIDMKDYQ